MKNTNKNYWVSLGYKFLFAAPWIAMIAAIIAHYCSTNENHADLEFLLISIICCLGIINARCEQLKNKITELENKLNKNENKN